MLRARFIHVFAWLLPLGLLGCGGDDEHPDARADLATEVLPPPSLRVLAITDLKGYLEPCGCTSRPLGGIDRMAARVASLSDLPHVVVSAGDLWFGNAHHAGPTHAQPEIWRAEALTDILGDLGVVAAVPGPLDRGHGDAVFRGLRERAPFAILGAPAGLVEESAVEERTADSAEGETPASTEGETREPTAALTQQVGGHTVLLLGVSDLAGAAGESLSAARDALQAAEDPDVVIALVRGDRRLARDVARLEGVDFVIMGGLDREDALPPSELGESWLLHGGRQGQGLLVLDLYRVGRGDWTNVSRWNQQVERERLDQEIARLRARFQEWEAEGHSETELRTQRGRLQRMEAERDALGSRPLPASGPAFSARWEELAPDAPRDAEVRERLAAYDVRVNDHNRVTLADREPPSALQGVAHYVGSEACGSCHEPALRWWRSHPHGRAYSTLATRNKEFHLDCVGCHVTGYEQPGGSTVTHLGEEGVLRNVGCENCHGPGSDHLEAPTEHPLAAETPERVCVACHNEEHSDAFVYEGYRASLLVPGHGRPEE